MTPAFFQLWCLKNLFPIDMARSVGEFLIPVFGTTAFARYLRRVLPGRNDSLYLLEMASSRKNGFAHIPEPEEPETEHPHWVYWIGNEVALQSINCSRCGNYVWSDTMGYYGLADTIVCNCE